MKRAAAILFLILLPSLAYSDEYDESIKKSLSLATTDFKESIKTLESAIASRPDDGMGYIARGMINYQFSGDPFKGGSDFKKGLALTDNLRDRELAINSINNLTTSFRSDDEFELFKSGFEATEKGEIAKAQEIFDKAINMNRGNCKLYYEAGYAQIELGDFEKAIRYLEDGRRINPAFIGILTELQFCYAHTGDVEKLQDVIKDITFYFGENPGLNHELAYSYFKSGNKAKAIEILEKNTKDYPEFFLSHFILAELYLREKEYKKSESLLNYFLKNSDESKVKKINAKIDYAGMLTDAKEMLKRCREEIEKTAQP